MNRNVLLTNTAVAYTAHETEYKIGKTTYVVSSVFNDTNKKDINKVIERLVIKEVKNDKSAA